MRPFVRESGLVVPLWRSDVDTDQIVPAAHLKRVTRDGFGSALFERWRYDDAGRPRDAFVLNDPRYAGASVLATGPNFGCGSSREHAVWALIDYGFRAVIAPSFADIFLSNSFQNGLLPVALPAPVAEAVAERAATPGYRVTVDLERSVVSDCAGLEEPFTVDPFRRECLLNGWDDIDLTLRHEAAITAFERRRKRTGFAPTRQENT